MNKNYDAPHIEVIEVAIEQGIAQTTNTEGFGGWQTSALN